MSTYSLLGHEIIYDLTPLLRTDFTDDTAWQVVVAEVCKEVDFGGGGDDGLYAPGIEPVEDHVFSGATNESLLASLGSDTGSYVLLADDQSMREAVAFAASGEAGSPVLSVVYVDLSVSAEDAEEFGDVPGRQFRVVASEVATIEANLSVSNMDFQEFADSTDQDGVFRGFSA